MECVTSDWKETNVVINDNGRLPLPILVQGVLLLHFATTAIPKVLTQQEQQELTFLHSTPRTELGTANAIVRVFQPNHTTALQ